VGKPIVRGADVVKARDKKIEAGRTELERRGFSLFEVRACKLCGVDIEIWRDPAGTKIPLELHPELDWKLTPHVESCRQLRKRVLDPEQLGKPAEQGGLF
jgi:hypothetical protein